MSAEIPGPPKGTTSHEIEPPKGSSLGGQTSEGIQTSPQGVSRMDTGRGIHAHVTPSTASRSETGTARSQSEARPEKFEGSHVDLEELADLVDRKLVKETPHPDPEVPLNTYNYFSGSRERGEWTPLRNICRGLIVNEEGLIVARPFPRIHDLGPEEELPAGEFTVYEKLDGNLGIQFPLDGEPTISTRGQFTDTRGRTRLTNATERLRSLDYSFDPEVTYLWEILDPDYPQIVEYDGQGNSVLLGMIETATGRELPLPNQQDVPFPVVPQIEGIQTTEDLRERVERPNTEGFVILDNQGDRSRIKSTGYTWKESARIGSVNQRIYERLAGGEDLNTFLATLPDEVREEIGGKATAMQQEYARIRKRSKGTSRGYEDIKEKRRAGEDVSQLIWQATWQKFKK